MSGKTAEHYISDDEVFTSIGWASTDTTRSIPYTANQASSVSIGDYIYLLSTSSTNYYNNYKYNTKTKEWTKLSDLPIRFYGSQATVVGTDIYLFGSYSDSSSYNKVYKYDTLTDTYTQLADAPSDYKYGIAIYKDGFIYLLSSYGRNCYKYNISTEVYTSLLSYPAVDTNPKPNQVAIVGNYIYVFSSAHDAAQRNAKDAYRYDILENTWTKLSNTPNYIIWSCVASLGSNIYIFGGGDTYYQSYPSYTYKYDTENDTYTRLDNVPYGSYMQGTAVAVNNDIYLLGGNSSNGTVNRKFHATSKSYETDNTVVMASGNTYRTKLFETNFEEDYQPLYGFADTYFYTEQDGLDGSMPVYYGDGTHWINIKNPPTEGGNE